jgi:hypothetical protein
MARAQADSTTRARVLRVYAHDVVPGEPQDRDDLRRARAHA